MAKKYWIGFLVLVILTSSIYIMLPGNVRIDVQKTRTIFYVWENESWVLSGIEYVNLFDGSAKMRAKSRNINYSTEGNITNIVRIANYKNNISTKETYTFDGSTKDVELFPINHEIIVYNATREGPEYILQYEVQKLLYTGETVWDISSPQSFGHMMKVEWEEGNYYSRIYKYKDKDEGKLTVKYRIDSNHFIKDVRLFDPVPIPNVIFDSKTPANNSWLNHNSIYVGVEISSCTNFTNVTYQLNGENLII